MTSYAPALVHWGLLLLQPLEQVGHDVRICRVVHLGGGGSDEGAVVRGGVGHSSARGRGTERVP